ncbi:4480_t:CDS:1, partial [Dentiscutata heterogama]
VKLEKVWIIILEIPSAKPNIMSWFEKYILAKNATNMLASDGKIKNIEIGKMIKDVGINYIENTIHLLKKYMLI